MNKFRDILHRFILAHGALNAFRLLLLPVLVLWTVIEVPSASAVALGVAWVIGIIQVLRLRGRWPRSAWAGSWLIGGIELGLALALPLFTGGWQSAWLLDAWIGWALVVRTATPRQLTGLICGWAVWAALLGSQTSGAVASETLFALMMLAVPALLVIINRQPAITAQATTDPQLAASLQALQRRFAHIKTALESHQGGLETSSLHSVTQQATHGIRELQALLDGIAPIIVTTPSIADRVQGIVQRWSDSTAIRATLVAHPAPRRLPPFAEHIVVRALEEALNNIERHAKASAVEVELRGEDDSILLTVRDNGVGLVHGTTQRPGSHGLRSLRYRVQEINGQMEVYEGVDGGLVVQLLVPLTVYAL